MPVVEWKASGNDGRLINRAENLKSVCPWRGVKSLVVVSRERFRLTHKWGQEMANFGEGEIWMIEKSDAVQQEIADTPPCSWRFKTRATGEKSWTRFRGKNYPGPNTIKGRTKQDQADWAACCFVTFSACGPFWPWTISNSTSSPSCRLL